MTNERQTELEEKFVEANVSLDELTPKYERSFSNTARYLNNGIYVWGDVYASDTRELWLLGILAFEGIYVEESDEEDED